MRVLFTTQPGEGHFNPLVPLAQALVAAGNDVAVACAPSFCPTVVTRGFRAFPMGIDWVAGDIRRRWPQILETPPEQRLAFNWGTVFAGDTAEFALPDLLAIAHEWKPDVIVRETTEFGGWLAAEALGLPHASVEVTLFAFYQQGAAIVARSLTRLREKVGLPPTDVSRALFAHLHLSFVPPSFEDPIAPLPATAHSLRPTLLDPLPDEETPAWLNTLPNRPTIYATLGTALIRTPDTFGAIITAIRNLDVTLIATLGRTLDPEQFGQQPKNVHLSDYISQALLLPHCDVVVTHGGFSTVLGALICGVPMVILPDVADRPVNARRAAALGAAIVLEGDQRSPQAIAAAVRTILNNPIYRQRARAAQNEIATLPGPERGVELLAQITRNTA